MKKVLHVINGEFYSGAERVQDLLALRLPGFGYECGFVCLRPRLFRSSMQAKNVPVYDVKMKSKFDFSVVSRVEEIVREGRYEIIHTHTPRAALIGRLVSSRTGIPFVHHVHSPTTRDTESFFRNFLNALVENWSLRKAQYLIPVSESLRRHLSEIGFSQAKIVSVPNGVPVVNHAVSYKALTGDWVVGVVALFRPRKGIEVFLESLAILNSRGLRVQVHAVGAFESQEYQELIFLLVERLGLSSCIHWTGFTRDVLGELRKMNFFVMPSLFGEGLPMVVIEAMSVGLPVIGTDVEGIPEVITPECGVIVRPSDSLQLAAALERLMSLPVHELEKMSAAALLRQQRYFSDVAMAKGVASVYNSLLRQ